MEFSAKQIAELLNGTVEGNPEIKINNVSKIEDGLAGTLSFLANIKYTNYIYDTNASVVLVSNEFVAERPVQATLIRVANPYMSLAKLLEYYHSNYTEKTGISELAFVHSTAKIGTNTYIAPFVYIGENVVVGDNTKIYPHTYLSEDVIIGNDTWLASGVKVYNGSKIGSHCIIHSGTVIGSDGFGFAPNQDNNYQKVPQIGITIIEDHVEIGANCTIDRATIGATIIRKGAKLDNLIQVGHNVEIGENTVMAAQVGVSGSTKIGKRVMVGGQVGFAGHLSIADDVKIGAQSGIAHSVKERGKMIMGSPAIDLRTFQKAAIVFNNSPELRVKLYQMERELAELKKKLNL